MSNNDSDPPIVRLHSLTADQIQSSIIPFNYPTHPSQRQLRPSQHSTKKRPKYVRSKQGCLSCRVRRVKCDETRPVCKRCMNAMRECVYPPVTVTSRKSGGHAHSQSQSTNADSNPGSRPSTPESTDSGRSDSAGGDGAGPLRTTARMSKLRSRNPSVGSEFRGREVGGESANGSRNPSASSRRRISPNPFAYGVQHLEPPPPAITAQHGPSTSKSSQPSLSSLPYPLVSVHQTALGVSSPTMGVPWQSTSEGLSPSSAPFRQISTESWASNIHVRPNFNFLESYPPLNSEGYGPYIDGGLVTSGLIQPNLSTDTELSNHSILDLPHRDEAVTHWGDSDDSNMMSDVQTPGDTAGEIENARTVTAKDYARGLLPSLPNPALDPTQMMSPEEDMLISLTYVKDHIEFESQRPIHTSGGFCDVFVGHHPEYGRVALKRPRVSDEWTVQDMRQFIREIRFWKSLSHASILPLLGAYKVQKDIYMVSPYLANGNLNHYLKKCPEIDRFRPLCETAAAVAHLHELRLIHGDIKAANVLISNDGCARLTDFGLAKLSSGTTSTALRGAGTTRWQSPELWDGGPKTHESDIYAFAMLIVEVLTGGPPFRELESDAAVIKAVLINQARPLRSPEQSPLGISWVELWDIAEFCWVTAPGDRPKAGELFGRLGEMVPSVQGQ